MILDHCDPGVTAMVLHYVSVLGLPTDRLLVTTDRQKYRQWIGRLAPSSYGGAYCFLGRTGEHAILINLERIDASKPRAVEVVIAEELIHMRDRLDGDLRQHAHHGHDRIARRVAELSGASLDDIRSALKPSKRRSMKYLYQCPGCGLHVYRRRKGTWSCGRCAPAFDRRYQLRIARELNQDGDRVG